MVAVVDVGGATRAVAESKQRGMLPVRWTTKTPRLEVHETPRPSPGRRESQVLSPKLTGGIAVAVVGVARRVVVNEETKKVGDRAAAPNVPNATR